MHLVAQLFMLCPSAAILSQCMCRWPTELYAYSFQDVIVGLGPVDQLITYTVSCNLSGPLVEVLEVSDLTNRC